MAELACYSLPTDWADDVVERVLALPHAAYLNGCGFPDTWNSLRANPSVCLKVRADRATLERDGDVENTTGEALEVLQRVLDEHTPTVAGARSDHNGPGWVVFTSYDLGFWVEPSAGKPQREGPDFPLIFAAFYPWALVPEDSGWILKVLAESEADAKALRDELHSTLRGQAELSSTPNSGLLTPDSLWSRAEYGEAFAALKNAIREGDIYQGNLTQRHIALGEVNARRLYKRLCSVSPAPYSCYLDCGEGSVIVSSSPELFYRVRDRVIETRPIKGTRRVVGDEASDEHIRAELLASEKDRAELVMIVDLERNDLGRVCEVGSVEVPELLKVESFAQVHHLVSTVRGKLRDDVNFVDLLRAGFPGGSITGAPKIRAMQVLRELEPHARGPYTGSIFALGLDGSIESNILIRTLLVERDLVSFNVGGGIVWDSDVDAEYEECHTKARGMLDALQQRD